MTNAITDCQVLKRRAVRYHELGMYHTMHDTIAQHNSLAHAFNRQNRNPDERIDLLCVHELEGMHPQVDKEI